MRKLIVFNSITLDGYFTDPTGDMSWAHSHDPEWTAFVSGNARGESAMVFGRITYEMMAGWWPSPEAKQGMPDVAERMNRAPKVVFSRTLSEAKWNNTRLVKGDLAGFMREMKERSGPDILIFGSGTVVSQLADEGLIDEFQIVVVPVVLGKGRTMFEKIQKKLKLRLTQSRTFANGNAFLCYTPVA